jgi:hypothetical protein
MSYMPVVEDTHGLRVVIVESPQKGLAVKLVNPQPNYDPLEKNIRRDTSSWSYGSKVAIPEGLAENNLPAWLTVDFTAGSEAYEYGGSSSTTYYLPFNIKDTIGLTITDSVPPVRSYYKRDGSGYWVHFIRPG